jgi:hypothetical protein
MSGKESDKTRIHRLIAEFRAASVSERAPFGPNKHLMETRSLTVAAQNGRLNLIDEVVLCSSSKIFA